MSRATPNSSQQNSKIKVYQKFIETVNKQKNNFG